MIMSMLIERHKECRLSKLCACDYKNHDHVTDWILVLIVHVLRLTRNTVSYSTLSTQMILTLNSGLTTITDTILGLNISQHLVYTNQN